MRYWALVLSGLGLLALAGCSSCGGGLCGKLMGRTRCETIIGAPVIRDDCGCAGAPAGAPAVAEEPILSAPQKLNAEPKKDEPGFAEPMPFVPKKN
jgi:hypothetical protein